MKNNKKVLVFKNVRDLSDFAVNKWIELSGKAIERSGLFTAALSGGKTPIPFYHKLAQLGKDTVDWNNIHIFLADERFVPRDTAESNYGMIKKAILEKIELPEQNMHAVPIKDGVNESAECYENMIKEFFSLKDGDFPFFDLVLLGIGVDGHMASLFAGDKAVLETSNIATAVRASSIKLERVTITLPVINNAKNIIFVVTGREKRETIKEVLNENHRFPASLVRPREGEALFLLDKEAAN